MAEMSELEKQLIGKLDEGSLARALATVIAESDSPADGVRNAKLLIEQRKNTIREELDDS